MLRGLHFKRLDGEALFAATRGGGYAVFTMQRDDERGAWLLVCYAPRPVNFGRGGRALYVGRGRTARRVHNLSACPLSVIFDEGQVPATISLVRSAARSVTIRIEAPLSVSVFRTEAMAPPARASAAVPHEAVTSGLLPL